MKRKREKSERNIQTQETPKIDIVNTSNPKKNARKITGGEKE
jgi:hypothetical protein